MLIIYKRYRLLELLKHTWMNNIYVDSYTSKSSEKILTQFFYLYIILTDFIVIYIYIFFHILQ